MYSVKTGVFDDKQERLGELCQEAASGARACFLPTWQQGTALPAYSPTALPRASVEFQTQRAATETKP